MNSIPKGWEQAPLGQVAVTQLGRMLSSRRDTGSNPKHYLRNRDVQWGKINITDLPVMDFGPKDAEKFLLRPGDVLVCEGGEVGRAAIWNGQIAECYYQKALHRVRTSARLLPEFLVYMLEHYARARKFDRFTSGSTIAHLPQEDFRELPIPLPLPPEQERIVAAIDEQFSHLDSGVAALRRAEKSLGFMKAAQLQSVMSASTTLPVGWRWVELGDLIASGPKNGIYLPGNRYGSGIPILRIDDFQNEWHRSRDRLRLVTPDPEQAEEFALSTGDLVINRVNSMTHLGKCLVVGPDLKGVLFESNMMRIRLSSEVYQDYIKLYLQSPVGRSLLLKRAKQAVNQASINQRDVQSTPVAVPPLDEQTRIVSIYQTSSSILSKVENEVDVAIRHSDSLRASILASAFSGQLVPTEQVTA